MTENRPLTTASTTWLLVRISPDELRTMPVPAAAPVPKSRTVVMSTTPAASASVAARFVAEELPLESAALPDDPVRHSHGHQLC